MADAFQLQSGSPDRILLQDGSGVLILQADIVASTDVFFATLHRIHVGMVPLTAAGMGGVIEE